MTDMDIPTPDPVPGAMRDKSQDQQRPQQQQQQQQQQPSRATHTRGGVALAVLATLVVAVLLYASQQGNNSDTCRVYFTFPYASSTMSMDRTNLFNRPLECVSTTTAVAPVMAAVTLAILLLLFASKVLVEARLASKVRRKLREKLEDSFDRPSCVASSWVRAGVTVVTVGVGRVRVAATAATLTSNEQDELRPTIGWVEDEAHDRMGQYGGGSSGSGGGDDDVGGEASPGDGPDLLTIDSMLFHVKPVSAFPWSSVRHIPGVQVVGMKIHINHAFTHSVMASGGGGGGGSHNNNNSDNNDDDNSNADGAGFRTTSVAEQDIKIDATSTAWENKRLLHRSAHGEPDFSVPPVEEATAVGVATAMGVATATTAEEYHGGAGAKRTSGSLVGGKDVFGGGEIRPLKRSGSLNWRHRGSSASLAVAGGDGGEDAGAVVGFEEWERIAQDALESVLGPQFARKTKVYTEEASEVLRRLSKIFSNLMKRYVLGKIVLQDVSFHLSAPVWRDLATSAFLFWEEGGDGIRGLLPSKGVEFKFDVSLNAREMGCESKPRTALDIVTTLTKRTMLNLGRAILAEARRSLFNRENMVEIMVDSLILGKAAGVKAPPPQSASRPPDARPNTLAAPAAVPNIGVDCYDGSGGEGEGGDSALGISAEGALAEAGVGRIGETSGGRTSTFASVAAGRAEQRRVLRKESALGGRGGGTLVGLLRDGLSTITRRRGVSEVLSVLKHAVFDAIAADAAASDNDTCSLESFELDKPSTMRVHTRGERSSSSSSSSDSSSSDSSSCDRGGNRPSGRASVPSILERSRGSFSSVTSVLLAGHRKFSSTGSTGFFRRGSAGAELGGNRGNRSGGGGGGRAEKAGRDEEGEAKAVAERVSELIREKDAVGAMKVFRAIQVSPLLEELLLYTELGPTLEGLKVDVQHMVTSVEGSTVGDLMDQALYELGLSDIAGSQDKLKKLQDRASRDIGRLKEMTGMQTRIVTGDEASKVAELAAKLAKAVTSDLTPQDLKAISKAISIFQGMRKRRRAAVKKAAAAAAAAAAATSTFTSSSTSTGTSTSASPLRSSSTIVDSEEDGGGVSGGGNAGGEGESGAEGGRGSSRGEDDGWNLAREVELLANDPDAADSLRHAVSRVTELTRGCGFFIDEYLALSVVEWTIGGILQEIPRLLPVAQTTVAKKGFIIKVSSINLGGVIFPRSEIRVSFMGISLPPPGSLVDTKTPFGLGRVVRYMKRTHSLCVELLQWPLPASSRYPYARAYLPPGNVVVIEEEINANNNSKSSRSGSPLPPGTAMAATPGVSSPATVSIRKFRSAKRVGSLGRESPPLQSTGGSGDNRGVGREDVRRRSWDLSRRRSEHRLSSTTAVVGEQFSSSERSHSRSNSSRRMKGSRGRKNLLSLSPVLKGLRGGRAATKDDSDCTEESSPQAFLLSRVAGVEAKTSFENVPGCTESSSDLLMASGTAGGGRHFAGSSARKKHCSVGDLDDLSRRDNRAVAVSLLEASASPTPSDATPAAFTARSPVKQGKVGGSANTPDAADGDTELLQDVGDTDTWPKRSRTRFRRASSGELVPERRGGRKTLRNAGSSSQLLNSGGSNNGSFSSLVESGLTFTAGKNSARRWRKATAGTRVVGAGSTGKGDAGGGRVWAEETAGGSSGKKPPFLSIALGEVHGELPDVRWSVQQKKFPRVEDSGMVRVWLEGISISISLDPTGSPAATKTLSKLPITIQGHDRIPSSTNESEKSGARQNESVEKGGDAEREAGGGSGSGGVGGGIEEQVVETAGKWSKLLRSSSIAKKAKRKINKFRGVPTPSTSPPTSRSTETVMGRSTEGYVGVMANISPPIPTHGCDGDSEDSDSENSSGIGGGDEDSEHESGNPDPIEATGGAERSGEILEGSSGDNPSASVRSAASGFLEVTECTCTVGSIRVEVEGSKHDGLYNFLAKGLTEHIRDAVRDAVENAISEEAGRLVARLNDRVVELWSGSAPVHKKPSRVVCTAIRGSGVGGRGKNELYVKVRLLQGNQQIAKRSTSVSQPSTSTPAPTSWANATTTNADTTTNNIQDSIRHQDRDRDGGRSEKDASWRNPSWLGLDNELTLEIPGGEDSSNFSLVFEVWHRGTLGNALVGSTRRITLPEVEALAAGSRACASESEDWWWDVDTGGKIMVKACVFRLP